MGGAEGGRAGGGVGVGREGVCERGGGRESLQQKQITKTTTKQPNQTTEKHQFGTKKRKKEKKKRKKREREVNTEQNTK